MFAIIFAEYEQESTIWTWEFICIKPMVLTITYKKDNSGIPLGVNLLDSFIPCHLAGPY
jgi:hypothetical protein